MARKRPTIADICANKGKVQYTMMRTESWDELAAAEAAGIDMVSVPPEVTAEISKHTDLFLVSMGGGKGGDCQYLFGCDVLGYTMGHVPRHAKKYANLAAEYARIQNIRVDAFKSFVTEVQTGAWPTPEYLVSAPKSEMDAFKKMLVGK